MGGVLTRVLPGMQSAFVDLGLEREKKHMPLRSPDFFEESEDTENSHPGDDSLCLPPVAKASQGKRERLESREKPGNRARNPEPRGTS